VFQAVAANAQEQYDGCPQHQGYQHQQDQAVAGVGHGRGCVVCEIHGKLAGGARDQVVDQVVEVRPLLDLRIHARRNPGHQQIDGSLAKGDPGQQRLSSCIGLDQYLEALAIEGGSLSNLGR